MIPRTGEAAFAIILLKQWKEKDRRGIRFAIVEVDCDIDPTFFLFIEHILRIHIISRLSDICPTSQPLNKTWKSHSLLFPMEQNSLIRRGLGLRGVDHDKVSPGYALYAHLTSCGTVRLVSNDGKEVHRWVCVPKGVIIIIDFG